MTYIFQPDRYLLAAQVRRAAPLIHGRVLDVGAGEADRYGGSFDVESYLRMDVSHAPHVDIVGSIYEIPAEVGIVNSIVCTQVFEHLSDPFRAVKEISRVLERGGTVLVTVPQTNELHEEPNDFFRYTSYGLKSLFESAGFETIFEEQRGGFFSTISQMQIRYCIDRFGLYRRPFLGRIFGVAARLSGRLAILFDSWDKSKANRKHAIGWCFVFKKK